MMLLVGWGCVLSLVVYNKVEVTLHFNETINLFPFSCRWLICMSLKIPFSSLLVCLLYLSPSYPTETEPLPPELQPLMAADDDEGSEVNATDPIVRLFLKRQRRMKEVKKRREAGMLERLQRFAVKKYYTIRRGWVLSSLRTHRCRQSVEKPAKQTCELCTFVFQNLDDSHCNEKPGGGSASARAADKGSCLRQHEGTSSRSQSRWTAQRWSRSCRTLMPLRPKKNTRWIACRCWITHSHQCECVCPRYYYWIVTKLGHHCPEITALFFFPFSLLKHFRLCPNVKSLHG